MIFNLGKGEDLRETVHRLSQEHDFDYELITYDRTVLHILGKLPEEKQRLILHRIGTNEQWDKPVPRKVPFLREYPPIIAGPCSVESREQLKEVVDFLVENGIKYIRGGVYKPRTRPESFQGFGQVGLGWLVEVARPRGLKIVTEVMDRSQIPFLKDKVDILQVGSRNMFNYSLLIALGAVDRPVLLKRGMSATIEEWYQSARYIQLGGNGQVIFCERGIRTFEYHTRNTLDLAAITLVKERTGYPVIVDPSHAAGRRDLVECLTLAAISAGADGVMIEIHPDPDKALSDGQQALDFPRAQELIKKVKALIQFRKEYLEQRNGA